MIRVIAIIAFLFAQKAVAADALYGAFSAMSPPGPIAPGTIWSVVVNSAALTPDPESLDFAFPTGPTRNYVRRSSERKGPTTLAWIGVNGKDEAIIYAEEGVVSGVIFNGTRHFELEAVQNGTKFEWVDQSKVGEPSLRLPTGAPLALELPKFEAPKAGRAREASVDVLFIYTQQAFVAVGGGFGGGFANIRSQINSAVAATNNAYLQSNANLRINVAGIEAAPAGLQDSCIPPAAICQSAQYGEAITQDLNNVLGNSTISARRNETSADMVVLIIENGGSAAPPDQAIILCGVARQMRQPQLANFAPQAYSVVRRSCATGNLTLAHELGHNMGLEHHPYEYFGSLPPDPTFPWSFAHSVGGTTSGFHSIMSTNYECVNQGFLCSLIPRFSNPDNTWPVNNGGVISQISTGVAEFRDNARALRSTGPIAESWRAGYFENGFESP